MPSRYPSVGFGQETHRRQRRYAFAAPGFADNGECFATLDLQREPVNGQNLALAAGERGGEGFDF
jgi:hypothetical protein